MSREYLDFDLALTPEGQGYAARVESSPAGQVSAPFTPPFTDDELFDFKVAVGPPRVATRRLAPAPRRDVGIEDYGRRLADALLSGDVARAFRDSLATAAAQDKDLRLRLRLDKVPEIATVPWEYLYDTRLDRFLTLSQDTPIVRLIASADRPVIDIQPPLRVLVMSASPTDMPKLEVDRELQLLRATTGDLVKSGQLEVVVFEHATLTQLHRALLDDYHAFHFIGHGGFDRHEQTGFLALENDDGTAKLVSGKNLGTLLHDARRLQLAVLNACEGSMTSGRNSFSGVGQALVHQGLPAVVAMQTEISDRAALVFSHEFYWFLSRGLSIDAAICEVRKAMAVSADASEWGTAVLLRSGSAQPFNITELVRRTPNRQDRIESLYSAAQGALASEDTSTALPLLQQIAAESPDYADVTEILERVQPEPGDATDTPTDTPAHAPEDLRTGLPTDEQAEQVAPPTESATQVPSGTRHPAASRLLGVRASIWTLGALAAIVVAGWLVWRHLPTLLQRLEPVVAMACGSHPTDSTGMPAKATTDLAVGCAALTPTVDGSFDDWRSVPVQPIDTPVSGYEPSPRNGQRGTWHALWDNEALFLHAVVTDSSVRPVDVNDPPHWYYGDAVSFEIGPDSTGMATTDPLRPRQDFFVMLGVLGDDRAAAAVRPAGRQSAGGGVDWFSGGTEGRITAVSRSGDEGYEIEARVPWSVIGHAGSPTRGQHLAMNVTISDAAKDGKLRMMLSSNPQATRSNQLHPATWQSVALTERS